MYKFSFILILLIFGSACSVSGQKQFTHAQNCSKKTKERYKEAYAHLRKGDLHKAEKGFLKLQKKDPNFVNAYLMASGLYLRMKDTAQAIQQLHKAIQLAPDYDPRVYLSLAKFAMAKKDYAEAAKQTDKLLSYDKLHPNIQKIGKKINIDAKFRPKALANPVPFEPKNLGEKINAATRDYFPSITLKDELVYTVQLGSGRQRQEDLYISRKTKDGWTPRQAIPGINTKENEGAQSISADGSLLVFTVCNRPEDFGSCDLYYSKKVNGRWTPPKNMGQPINSPNWESQPSIAPNADAIYFVRGGARGTGHKDIYVSQLQNNGQWGKPQKVEELNTAYDESAPCIHPDGQTLYFSSEGHEGMGKYDLFVSRLQENGKWGKPQNLGYPINTEAAEEALAVNRSGHIAYLASNREGGFGSLDIYSFDLPKFARPNAVTYIQGITLDDATNKPLSAEVEIIDLRTQKVFTKIQTPQDGTFTICLPTGDYALNARRKGYAFFSANYNLIETKSLEKPYQLEARLQPLPSKENKQKHQPIVLENVFFETASAALKDASIAELNKLKQLLDENPAIRIQLNGHTDNVGKPEDNMTLSQQRAEAVQQYLIKNGIEAQRIKAKGFGETQPIADNESKEGRAKNRRTEFQILDN